MSAALYIGRVGALAVALGIGVAIAGVPGLAWAGPEPGSDPAEVAHGFLQRSGLPA